MRREYKNPSSKLNIVISGALPPPMGGVGYYYQTLLNSQLANHVNLTFVQTSSHRQKLFHTGKVTFSNIFDAIQDCWRFTKAVYIHRPQIAHISTAIRLSFVKNTFCIIIARLLGSKVLLHPHCSLSVLYYERPKWWQLYFRFVIRLTCGVVALSKEWLDLKTIMPGKRIYYLPNAINTQIYQSVADKHISGTNSKKICKVLYLGYLGRTKGSFDLLKAAIDIRTGGQTIEFDLVGGAMAEVDLALLHQEVKTSKMEEFIRIHPLTFGEEKLSLLRNADIFVYPSYYEGMPIAVLEAMACGLPIVATKVGGLVDLIEDGVSGFLVDPGQPDQLIQAFTKLAKSHELRLILGKTGYQKVHEKYDIDKHIINLVDIYKNLLSDQSKQ